MATVQVVPALRPKWLALGAVVVLLGLVLRTAWVTEDAYITLRTVDNWVNGFGLRWNTDERVQAYTNPLWMMLLSAFYYVTRESFGTTIFVGMATTLAALLVMVRGARSAGHAVTAVTLLILSRAFVQFSTSGLENPLAHLLVGLFVYQYAARRADDVPRIAMTAALLALNRVDALIVVLPALLHVCWLSYRLFGLRQLLRDLLIGFSPLLAWEAFSLVYYGFLVPNTAYAKLNTGVPKDELARQGMTYLLNAVSWDLALAVATGLGVASTFYKRRPRELLLALGVVLYLFYVVRIGGDFMLGRFLTIPLFLAVCLVSICELPLEDPARASALTLPFLVFYFHPAATDPYPVGDFMHSGVADERVYYREAQLMLFSRMHSMPAHSWVAKGREARANKAQGEIFDNVGFFGFYAGPEVHITDQLALAEPLLARLPATYYPTWRVGHYSRLIPDGYIATVIGGKCVMEDKNLCEFYGKLREIVSGDLFTWRRLQTIVAMNLGQYDYLIDRRRYRHPNLTHGTLAELSAPVADGSAWNGEGCRTLKFDGIDVDLGLVQHPKKIALFLDGNDDYTLEMYKNRELVGSVFSPAGDLGFMHERVIEVPAEAVREGFDTLTVRPGLGDAMYSLGNVRLLP